MIFSLSFLAELPARSYGEPHWMPAPQDVARARARLERRGAVRSLSQDTPFGRVPALVGPGESPWLWWVAAVLWVLVWPAALTFHTLLRSASDALAWLPRWLPPVLALFHMLVLAGPVLYAERMARKDDLRRRFGQVQTLAEMLALEPGEFEVWTGILFQLIGYRVRNTKNVADHGIDLVVSNPNASLGTPFGRVQLAEGLVQCKRYRGTVGEPAVRDLYGTIVHEGAGFGWLVTTGGVSRQARDWAEGKPLELWDGPTLVRMARHYR